MAEAGFDAAALPPLRDVIREHDLFARKGLGQHFLFDLNLTRKIVRAAGDLSGATAIEIGAGPGGLTRALLESAAARVVAVERDPRCLAALAELEALAGDRLTVVPGDALACPLAGLGPPPRHIVANLPYNVSTALFFNWLDEREAVAAMTLMFQKEVAERLLAAPGSKAYGRLSVTSQWLCEVRRAFDVPPRAFVPPPKVQSTVVSIVPRKAPHWPAEKADVEAVAAAAFGQRRKMLRQSLRALGVDPIALCAAAALDPTVRAEDVSIEGFCALARAYRDAVRTARATP